MLDIDILEGWLHSQINNTEMIRNRFGDGSDKTYQYYLGKEHAFDEALEYLNELIKKEKVGNKMINVKVKRLDENAMMPERATSGSAGFDLQACLVYKDQGNLSVKVDPGERVLIGTGLAFEIPQGYEMQIRPRSGLAYHFGITVLNSPGTIDSDYRDEVRIIVINHGSEPFTVVHGDRVAQAVFTKLPDVVLTEVDAVDVTGRGGFGSTGK